MSSGNFVPPDNEEPFVDNPILAARRRAFDYPTQENLCRLTDVCHNETRRLFNEQLLALRRQIQRLRESADE